MPEGAGIIHPFLAAIITSRAVKEVVHAGIGISNSAIRFAFAATFCFIKELICEFGVFDWARVLSMIEY